MKIQLASGFLLPVMRAQRALASTEREDNQAFLCQAGDLALGSWQPGKLLF